MNFFEELREKSKLVELRKKWLAYQKKGSKIMCSVIEKQVKVLKGGKNVEKTKNKA